MNFSESIIANRSEKSKKPFPGGVYQPGDENGRTQFKNYKNLPIPVTANSIFESKFPFPGIPFSVSKEGV
jgi:hypothetical protein